MSSPQIAAFFLNWVGCDLSVSGRELAEHSDVVLHVLYLNSGTFFTVYNPLARVGKVILCAFVGAS
jgi:hypothetical protein